MCQKFGKRLKVCDPDAAEIRQLAGLRVHSRTPILTAQKSFKTAQQVEQGTVLFSGFKARPVPKSLYERPSKKKQAAILANKLQKPEVQAPQVVFPTYEKCSSHQTPVNAKITTSANVSPFVMLTPIANPTGSPFLTQTKVPSFRDWLQNK